jgi:hypothetical protein
VLTEHHFEFFFFFYGRPATAISVPMQCHTAETKETDMESIYI